MFPINILQTVGLLLTHYTIINMCFNLLICRFKLQSNVDFVSGILSEILSVLG